MSEVLEHLPFLPRELIEVLKKGAVVVVSFPNINPYQPFYFILRRLPKIVKKKLLDSRVFGRLFKYLIPY
ncbi:MAG: hypothetical protein QXP55_01510 [Nitrososphaerales archaeon]